MGYLDDILLRHRRAGILLDTNVLLLYLCGRSFRTSLDKLKFLRKYTPSNVDLVERIVDYFPRVVTTAHILTEASNIAGRDLREDVRQVFWSEFRESLETWDERVVPVSEVSMETTLEKFGLTDAVLEKLAQEQILVLSDDRPLTGLLTKRGLPALNLRHFTDWD